MPELFGSPGGNSGSINNGGAHKFEKPFKRRTANSKHFMGTWIYLQGRFELPAKYYNRNFSTQNGAF